VPWTRSRRGGTRSRAPGVVEWPLYLRSEGAEPGSAILPQRPLAGRGCSLYIEGASRSLWRRRVSAGGVAKSLAPSRIVRRRRIFSGSVAKSRETSRSLRRRCELRGGDASRPEASQRPERRRVVYRAVAYCPELSQTWRRGRKSSGDVAKSQERMQPRRCLRQIALVSSAAGEGALDRARQPAWVSSTAPACGLQALPGSSASPS
jgi:hypothetical protein